MCYAPENDKEVFDLRVLGFACYIIFNSVFRKEVFDLRMLGFNGYDIFISIFGEETFDLRVLGRGPRRANSDFISFTMILLEKFKAKSLFYVILSHLMRFIIILFKNSKPNRNLLQFYSKNSRTNRYLR